MFKAIGKTQQNGTPVYQIENGNNKQDICIITEADLKMLLAFGISVNGTDNTPLSIGPRGGIYGTVREGIRQVIPQTKPTPKDDYIPEKDDPRMVAADAELAKELSALMEDYPSAEETGISTGNFSVYKLEPEKNWFVIYDKNKEDFVTDSKDNETLFIFDSPAQAIDYAQKNLAKKEEPTEEKVDLSDEEVTAEDSEDEAKTAKLYAYLTVEQEQLLQKYYMWFSRRHFDEEYKDPLSSRLAKNTNAKGKKKLEAKKQLLDQLHAIHTTNGIEHKMVYGGYIDNHRVKHYLRNADGSFQLDSEGNRIPDEDRNAYCSIGHAIRYMHIAWDVDIAGDPDSALFSNHQLIRDSVRMDKKLKQAAEEGKCIIFGCSIGDKSGACLGDFFGVEQSVIKALHDAQIAALKDMELLLDIYEKGEVQQAINSFGLMDKFIASTKTKNLRYRLAYGKDFEAIVSTPYVVDNRLCEFYQEFRRVGMIPPKTLVQEIRQSMIGWVNSKFTKDNDSNRSKALRVYSTTDTNAMHLRYPVQKDFKAQLCKVFGNYGEYLTVSQLKEKIQINKSQNKEYVDPETGEVLTEKDAVYKDETNQAIDLVTSIYWGYLNNTIYCSPRNLPNSSFLIATYLYLTEMFCYEMSGYYRYNADTNKDEGGKSKPALAELRAISNYGIKLFNEQFDFSRIPVLLKAVNAYKRFIDIINSQTITVYNEKINLLRAMQLYSYRKPEELVDFTSKNKDLEPIIDEIGTESRFYTSIKSYRNHVKLTFEQHIEKLNTLIEKVEPIYQSYKDYLATYEEEKAKKIAILENKKQEYNDTYEEFNRVRALYEGNFVATIGIIKRDDMFDVFKKMGKSAYDIEDMLEKIGTNVKRATELARNIETDGYKAMRNLERYNDTSLLDNVISNMKQYIDKVKSEFDQIVLV